MSEIKLTQGLVALVDEEDFEWLSQLKWCVLKSLRTHYAKRTQRGILMHREILLRHGVVFDCVDHVNHNGLDNRKRNLRGCWPHDNSGNMIKVRGSSKFKGVHLDSATGLWRASIQVNRRVLKSPRMRSEEDAALWYNKQALQYFGEFALLNAL